MNARTTTLSIATLAGLSAVSTAQDIQFSEATQLTRATASNYSGGAVQTQYIHDQAATWSWDLEAWLSNDHWATASISTDFDETASDDAVADPSAVTDTRISGRLDVSAKRPYVEGEVEAMSGFEVTVTVDVPTVLTVTVDPTTEHNTAKGLLELGISGLKTGPISKQIGFDAPSYSHTSVAVPAGEYDVFISLNYQSWGPMAESAELAVEFSIGSISLNDEPEDAWTLHHEFAPVYTTLATNSNPALGAPAGGMHRDVWYILEPDSPEVAWLSTCNLAEFDTTIAVYEGLETPVSPDRLVAWNDDAEDCPGYTSNLEFAPECGKKYLVRIGGYGANSHGTAVLQAPQCVNCIPCPAGSPADFNGDGKVNSADLGLLLANWGACDGCPTDLNGDGHVDGQDLGLLFAAWNS